MHSGLLGYTHACGVALQTARLVCQASSCFVHLDKSSGTFGNDAVSGVVISSGGGGGICGGLSTTGDGGLELAQAISSKLIGSSAASFFNLVIMGDLSDFGLQGLLPCPGRLLGLQGGGGGLGGGRIPPQLYGLLAAGVGFPVAGG